MWRSVVEKLLAERIGLDSASVGASVLEQAVRKRMTAIDVADPSDYVARLSIPEEVIALVEEVVVSESWFFRDVRPFLRLQEFARQRAATFPLRILSLPCAAGEEAYSIAIALLEAGISRDRVQIDAMDVSERSIEKARRGVFGRSAFRGPEFCERSRYFGERADGFEIDPSIRSMVRFFQGNILDVDLLKDNPRYTAIFCRNLLIYLTGPARHQALSNLDRLLSQDGLLFLGHAEALSILERRFVADEDRGSFAYRRAVKSIPSKLVSDKVLFPLASSSVKVFGERSAHAFDRQEATVHASHEVERPASFSPPNSSSVALPAEAGVSTVESEATLLDEAARLANRQQFDESASLCERSIREHGPTARAYFLLGMMELARGDADLAESSLLKVVYLDGSNDEALLVLALIRERCDDHETASRYRKRAERVRRNAGGLPATRQP